MRFSIQLHDGTLPIPYWSDSKFIHPAGHWGEAREAKQFDSASDAQEYVDRHLQTQAELCKVTPLK